MNQNKKPKQTLESAQYGLEIIFKFSSFVSKSNESKGSSLTSLLSLDHNKGPAYLIAFLPCHMVLKLTWFYSEYEESLQTNRAETLSGTRALRYLVLRCLMT